MFLKTISSSKLSNFAFKLIFNIINFFYFFKIINLFIHNFKKIYIFLFFSNLIIVNLNFYFNSIGIYILKIFDFFKNYVEKIKFDKFKIDYFRINIILIIIYNKYSFSE